jgi:hypothetical protein
LPSDSSRFPGKAHWPALLTLILCVGAADAAPRRAAAKPSAAKPETVYVASPTPPPERETRAEMRTPEPAREPSARRTEAAFGSPLRDYSQSFGGYAGFYVAEVLGTNPYGVAFMEYYPAAMPIFFQFDCGAGTVQSSFSKSIIGADNFDHNFQLSLDALGGYSLTGQTSGAGRGGGLFPYFLAGITAFWQGGLPIIQNSVPNIGGVIGFGNRMRVPFITTGRDWAFNYVVRDNIYSQKLQTKPSFTQNFALLVGIQRYW